MRLLHFSLSTWTLLNLNHFPQNESEKVSIALYDRIQISVFVVSLYILESSKKVFVLHLSWSQQFKQSKKLIFVNEPGLFTLPTNTWDWSRPKITLSNYGFSFFCLQIILVNILDKIVESHKEFLIRQLKRFLANQMFYNQRFSPHNNLHLLFMVDNKFPWCIYFQGTCNSKRVCVLEE